ncbi:MAG TPA: hypothetical protein VEK55_10780 [Xanthobacteraceae bacterium]|nr:hypothetical protein [Xanthobacteraceae bacterium]
MSIKITGLEELQKKLDDAGRAFRELDGEISTVKFNPNDPSSVEAAVVRMEQTIDAKVAPFRGNEIVEGIIEQLKEKYQQEIYDRAAKARLQREAS